MKRKLLLLAAACIASFTSTVYGATEEKVIRDTLEKYNMVVEVIKPSPIVGLNVVETSTGVVYITDDGKYLLQGPIYDMSGKTPVNISNQPLLKKVEALKDEMIIFKAPQEKYVVTVFTDISCGYCKKLHESVDELNRQGVTVRYLAYPRQGADSDVGKKMASIWCNGLQQKALTQAFKGEDVAIIDDCKIDLSKHMSVGNLFKVTGTPAIILPDGQMLPGYMKPDALVQLLNEK
ncbi:TPA: bifunctional protein-disulfide isomerase/oxidoreductase DsbC [Providencia rettgeri]|uniref:bifunctional protein-disulfide isomerase/oxidoreductase DsbC n=1 Tax=Providencia TaxID=586 RepID=UPI001B9ECDFE|nr:MULTISPECIES: bifunctional protein-disulfide isomerase/oxidoreductase DsbC [Providencia]EMB5786018.1 bifunctional protein-disulfide isomerase/oxidoreductase DsbC [Providencia rettgeri]MDK7744650.1 bifunctional protein-disulfide isomerase/oxidoreductase DsbC [Providencia rettgeri]MDK7757372.1 bifunctional protein-disulfide isomerase/oxidoreductase DsbC [Providencia rettgeri]HBC7428539.1 bifunctional protein-disulfide isomerase/oxidoreductase DsbC [Providencia rettgeri]